MKKIFYIILVFVCCNLNSQTITPQVINSAGMAYPNGVNGVFITDNVGEAVIETLGPNANVMISQGFLQPDITSKIGPKLSWIKNDVSCKDKKDGNISLTLSNILPFYNITYSWSPNAGCSANNCSNLDSLVAGTYYAEVIISYTTPSGLVSDTLRTGQILINDLNGPCRVKIYSAVTPNGDNTNDIWQIDNITEFPNNQVMIFTRWGHKVFETTGYDNTTKFWPDKDNLNKLDPSTYFYIITLGDGSNSLKGWVELIKN